MDKREGSGEKLEATFVELLIDYLKHRTLN